MTGRPDFDFYDGKGLLKRVDGVGELDEVTARLVAAVEG